MASADVADRHRKQPAGPPARLSAFLAPSLHFYLCFLSSLSMGALMRFATPLVRAVLCAAAMIAAGSGVARAQSLTNGALRGVALYATESTPIVGVQITVEGSDGRAISSLETDGSGLFTV